MGVGGRKVRGGVGWWVEKDIAGIGDRRCGVREGARQRVDNAVWG